MPGSAITVTPSPVGFGAIRHFLLEQLREPYAPARSVTTAEIVAAIAQQTGRELNKADVELPEIKKVGTYEARVKLHPEVFGEFKVVVQREKNA